MIERATNGRQDWSRRGPGNAALGPKCAGIWRANAREQAADVRIACCAPSTNCGGTAIEEFVGDGFVELGPAIHQHILLVGDEVVDQPCTALAELFPVHRKPSLVTLLRRAVLSTATSVGAEAEEGGFAERSSLQGTRYFAHITARLEGHLSRAHHFQHNQAGESTDLMGKNSAEKPNFVRSTAETEPSW